MMTFNRIKLVSLALFTAVIMSATSAFAISVQVVAIDNAALALLDPAKSLDLGGGVWDTPRTAVTGSSDGLWRSPWEGNPALATTTEYWTAGPGGAENLPNPAILNYSTGQSSFSFLWGSVDTYNLLSFRSFFTADETVSGTDILSLLAGSSYTPGRGAVLVSISGFANQFTQVEFLSDPSNAFEFSNIAIPLPAALPLFGTGLAVMSLLGWRRKRKAV